MKPPCLLLRRRLRRLRPSTVCCQMDCHSRQASFAMTSGGGFIASSIQRPGVGSRSRDDRRKSPLLRGLPWLLLVLSGLFLSPGSAAEKNASRPDILFIAIDDLNDWLTLFDRANPIRTPNLERLAARGCFFTRAYCAAPVCNASRTALLTGLRPTTTGVYDNIHPWRRALPRAITLPKYFSDHGYATCGAGKIFHHGAAGVEDPANPSFQRFQPLPNRRPKPRASVAQARHHVGSPRPHDLSTRQPCGALSRLALYPLLRRHGGAIRPTKRSLEPHQPRNTARDGCDHRRPHPLAPGQKSSGGPLDAAIALRELRGDSETGRLTILHPMILNSADGETANSR